MKASFKNIEISSILGVVPKNVSYFDDEIKNFSHPESTSRKLKKTMGYDQHRIVRTNVTTSDFAIKGIREMENSGEVNIEEIDALIFVSQTPDYLLPATSSILHGKLKLKKDCYCIDINDGCNGYVKGLYEAASLIQNGNSENILLITGDILSKKVSTQDRNSYPLIGDACCITLVRKNEDASHVYIEIQNDGSGYEALLIPAGGARKPFSKDTENLEADKEGNIRSENQLKMKGRDVFTFTQTTVVNFIIEFLENCNSKTSDFGLFFFHQANSFILSRLRKKLGIEVENLPDVVIRKYGNSSSATIPLSICEYLENSDLKKKNLRSLLAGFGVGLSWGCVDINLETVKSARIMEIDY